MGVQEALRVSQGPFIEAQILRGTSARKSNYRIYDDRQ